MAQLSQNTIRLLDRLFNLKGEDNVIIKRIKDEISTTENEMTVTTQEKNNNEVQKNELQGKLTVFQNQSDSFKAVFEGIDDATFASLREIGIEFEISKMLSTIEEKAPDYIASLNDQINEYGKKIEDNEHKIEELTNNLENLHRNQATSEEDRLKLTSLLDQSLSSSEIEREVLTVNFVKKILSLFDLFDENEIKELTKIIMFPDDGLFEYAKNYDKRLANDEISLDDQSSVTEENNIEEIKPIEDISPSEETEEENNESSTAEIYKEEITSSETTPDVEEPSVEDNQEEIINITNDDSTSEIDLSSLNNSSENEEPKELEEETEETTIDSEPTTIIPIIEPDPEPVEESIEEFLEKIGLSIQKFTDYNETPVSEIMAYLNQIDRTLIERNYEILRSLNVDEETIYKYFQNILYLADSDLNNKITILRAKGINDKIITQNLNELKSCFRLSYEEFQKRINAIETMDGSLTEENAYLLSYDVALYEENLSLLNDAGYDMSEEEKRNFCYVLSTSINTKEIIEILKNYLISITRKNGKYALGVLWQKPYNLLTGIDDLIEYNLENIIATNPEVLATNIDNVIRRVKYCEENGIPVSEEGATVSYFDYILNQERFTKKFGQVELPTLANRHEINQILAEIISAKENREELHKLSEILKDYYASTKMYSKIELNAEQEQELSSLLQKMTNNLKAELIGKNTYKLNNLYISKNKLERHLAIFLSHKEELNNQDNYENEILLMAALYNMRQDEGNLQKFVTETLGFNRNDANGGA